MDRRKALGRGLETLIPRTDTAASTTSGGTTRGVATCAIEDLHPQHGQPRKVFEEARLDELAQSIREQGILQPILARRLPDGGLEIIAGERRWRAAQRAGLQEVPVLVREATDDVAFELALVENLQREDLNPIESAEALQRLLAARGLTQEDLAQRVGKDRSTVANTLRLLKLPPLVQARVATGELSSGHARALLGCPDAATTVRLAERVVAGGLSVRATEALVRASLRTIENRDSTIPSPAVRDLVTRMQRALGAKVKVHDRKGKGSLEIAYASYDDLDRIIEKILS
jgi:ParB family transcriptional regulator, chromosome partitioning protein